jgi:hypothetical protein
MTKILGVDPGVRGGLAIVRLFESCPRLVDFPTSPARRSARSARSCSPLPLCKGANRGEARLE